MNTFNNPLTRLSQELHSQIRRNFQRRKVYSPYPNWIWSCDLIDYSQPKLVRDNDGYKYILCIVDVFSRYAQCIPMKDKSGQTLLRVFRSGITEPLPKAIWSDRGKEFYNIPFQEFCRDHNIELYSTYSESKSVIAERFIRTLKGWIEQYLFANNTRRWLDVLPELVLKYNEKKHRSINISPMEALLPENYIRTYMYQYREYNNNTDPESRQRRLKVGDEVRISRLKDRFEKGYDTNWSEEVFKVSRVLDTSPITYKLTEWKPTKGQPQEIEGSFYRDELLKTNVVGDAIFRVEKVLKVKGNKEYVKWFGWPNKYNSWIEMGE